MNSSFLYHAWGLYNHKCTREEYKGNTIILHIESKEREKVCPACGHRQLVKNGFRIRDFIGLPIGGKKVIIRMKVQRYKCKNRDCSYDRQESIPFATGSCGYTHRFAKYVVGLLRGMTLKDTANLLGVSWDTVKDIHTRHLEYHYAPPSLEGVDSIGIDEFAVRKGHVYKTIVVDLKSGRIIHVGDGKGADSLDGFWKRVRRRGVGIKYVATDLSAAFISSVYENCPNAVHVFDHFHVVKLMNEKLDEIRRVQYSMEKDINKRKVLKGTRYLLLSNGADIFDKEYKTRLDNALDMNRPLSQAYYLKEQLREIWTQVNKDEAENVMIDWIRQAQESKVPQLMGMAATVMAHRTGILAWYDCHISTGKVEGINNKIKVMKRTAYGFRDERYFELRLYALHDCRITRNVGWTRLDTLFLVLPISWKGNIAQYAGRLHRDYDGKNEVRIYDYIDIRVPLCDSMYRKRLKGYASIGYGVPQSTDRKDFSKQELIYNGQTFSEPFRKDLLTTKHSIVISCQKIKYKYTPRLVSLLRDLMANGIEIVVHVKEQGYNENELKEYGIEVLRNKEISIQCAVIDKSIIWYGNINFFGYNTEDNNVMRINDSSIANELLNIVCQ